MNAAEFARCSNCGRLLLYGQTCTCGTPTNPPAQPDRIAQIRAQAGYPRTTPTRLEGKPPMKFTIGDRVKLAPTLRNQIFNHRRFKYLRDFTGRVVSVHPMSEWPYAVEFNDPQSAIDVLTESQLVAA